MATLSRDQLVRALLARVQLFTVTLDREAVLAPGALAQAEALMAEVPDPARDPAGRHDRRRSPPAVRQPAARPR